jgi:hypothetical protein
MTTSRPFFYTLRIALLTQAAGLLILGYGFWLKAGWAMGLWPWPDGPLSYLFISSMLLAEGATMAWLSVTMELNAARGGSLGFAAMNAGISTYTLYLFSQRHQSLLLGWAVVCGTLAVGGLVIFAIGAAYGRRDVRSTPPFVRVSFLLFSAALFIATAMLLARMPVVFPWPLKPDSSVMFGFLFLASAIYFLDGWLRPGAANAFGQLLGFLVYDIVLIPPYLHHWSKVSGGFRVSLVIYLIVLFWSAALALWFWTKYGLSRNTKRA